MEASGRPALKSERTRRTKSAGRRKPKERGLVQNRIPLLNRLRSLLFRPDTKRKPRVSGCRWRSSVRQYSPICISSMPVKLSPCLSLLKWNFFVAAGMSALARRSRR